MATEPLDDDARRWELSSSTKQDETSVVCLACLVGHETSMLPHDDRMLVLISAAFPFIALALCGSHACPPQPAVARHSTTLPFPKGAASCRRRRRRRCTLCKCLIYYWQKSENNNFQISSAFSYDFPHFFPVLLQSLPRRASIRTRNSTKRKLGKLGATELPTR